MTSGLRGKTGGNGEGRENGKERAGVHVKMKVGKYNYCMEVGPYSVAS